MAASNCNNDNEVAAHKDYNEVDADLECDECLKDATIAESINELDSSETS